ncbi:MAG TPA: DNA polymerase/3'-5' exonuclease PolX [Verrucomicrobiales bacterium]|nr:DNA polymerase/3'-5' exonuclease PolX [Verrucomicrobiales bacterium]
MSRELFVDVLEKIALLLELKGENPFKVRAYRTGAEVVQGYPGDIVQLARDNKLAGIKGIGDALRDKLHELATTGELAFYEKLKAEFPVSIFELFEINGLGPKKIALLNKELGVVSVEDLKRVCESGEAAKLAGFGEKTVLKLLESIAFRDQHADTFRLDDAAPAVMQILDFLRGLPETSRAEVGGSFRRGKETVHDLDFLVATKMPGIVMEAFVKAPFVASVLANGETKSSIRLANGLQCDLRAVKNEEWAFALAYFTGSKEHNILMRSRALAHGWTLNEYRLAPVGEDSPAAPPNIHEERDLHRALGLDFIDPALREASGEVLAAESGDLPVLIELENLRGTFHNHTTASDGVATLEQMADAAIELGLQYLGIADHSKASFQANGLSEERLREQILAIKEMNKKWDGDFRLFTGCEVDILKDGSLDFPDELLSQLDYVVASVHNVFTLSEEEQTKRIIRAIENPNVTMLGHATGRLLLKRDGYAVNIPAIIDACAATGTIIELNASPWRLDMDWRWWRMAKEKGVKCSINPDAHSCPGLKDLWFGVRAARKGWLTRDDVVNCLPLGKIEEVLGTKRTR